MSQILKRISEWLYEKPLRTDLAIIALLFLLWGFYFWRLWAPNPADRVSYPEGDYSGQFLAFGSYQAERLLAGEIPLWNPYNNAGHPFLADTQAAVFYLPRLITIFVSDALFDGWNYIALQTETVVHYLLASIFMYLFVRSITSSVTAGFASGIVFAYGGFLTGYPPLQLAVLEAAVWTPLALLGVFKAFQGATLNSRWLAFAGLTLGIGLTAGHPQTSLFSSYLLIAYVIHQGAKQKISWLPTFSAALLVLLLGFGLAAVQLLPGLEYTQLTTRAGFGFDQLAGGFPYSDLLTVIYPESLTVWSPLYQGVLPLILSGIAIWKGQGAARYWGVVGLVALTLSFGGAAITYQFAYQVVPGFGLFRGQERAAFLLAIVISVLCGYGVAWVQTRERVTKFRKPLWIAAAVSWVLAIEAVLLSSLAPQADLFNLLKAAFLFALLLTFTALLFSIDFQVLHWGIFAGALIVFDLFSVTMNTNFEPIAAQERDVIGEAVPLVLEDETLFRVDGRVGLGENYGTLTGVQDIRGTSPLRLAAADTYLDSLSQQRHYQLLNVRYSFTDAEQLEIPSAVLFEQNDTAPPVRLHRLTSPPPRAWMAYNVFDVTDDAQAVGLINDPSFDPFSGVTMENRPDGYQSPERLPENSSVEVTNFHSERIELLVETPTPGILVLSEWYYPGWQVEVDGQAVELLRVNAGLRGVALDAGEHTIVLDYHPLSYRIGLGISLGSLVAIVVLLIANWTPIEEIEDG